MTLFSLRTGFALLLAASLASCGGGDKETYPITGAVSGLVYGPLTLTAAGQTLDIQPSTANTATTINAVTYTFPKALGYGDVFLVALGANPPNQNCTVGQSTADSAGHTAVINVGVVCNINQWSVTGTVKGLTTEGLTLINGSTSGTITVTVAGLAVTDAAGTASFAFTGIPYNTTYGVSILTQPTGQTCTLANGTGTLGNADYTGVTVTCV
jgi:hypothetical protein